MSAIIPNFASNPNPQQTHNDPSQFPYSDGNGIDGSAFDLDGHAVPITETIAHSTPYEQFGLPMSETAQAVLVPTRLPKSILLFHCEICDISCNSKDLLEAHKQGKKHLKSVKKLTESSANGPKMVPPPVTSETLVGELADSSVSAPNMVPVPPPVGSETLVGELENKRHKLLRNEATAGTLIYCDICNVVCNNQEVFNTHVAGKKHSAKSIIQLARTNGVFDATSNSIGGLQKKSDTFPCEICKITCNSNELLKMHIAGKKHLKKVKDLGDIPNLPLNPIASHDPAPAKLVVNTESIEVKTVNLHGAEPSKLHMISIDIHDTLPHKPVVNPESIEAKTTNLHGGEPSNLPLTLFSQDTPSTVPVVNTESIQVKTVNLQGAKPSCELCGIICDTDEVLKVHLLGKKHRKNLEKSERLIGPNPAHTTESAETPKMIGPLQEEGKMVTSDGLKTKRKKGGSDVDVETKKQRLLQCGTASDAVHICDLCNVVCNSSKVFIAHLGGQKHAALAVKRAETQARATGQES